MDLESVIAEVAPHTDITGRELALYVDIFAKSLANGGPALEIGTRAGGSALAILRVIDPDQMLFTVDPYGEKPYLKGGEATELVYGSDFYVQAKTLLAPFANHAHFLMTGEDFTKLLGTTYWWKGEQRTMTDFSLAFLDGDHSKVLIPTLRALEPHIRVGGRILIDNADWDGNVVDQILSNQLELELYSGRTCLVRKV